MDAALAGETLADMAVDLLAESVTRRHDPGVLALLRGEPEPSGGDRAGDVVRLHLGDVAAELFEGAADVALEARLDGFLQLRIALAHDLVHGRGLHAGGLELCEGLAGIDGVELFCIAHQHHARDAHLVGDAQQVASLHGRGERTLVDHQDGLREGRAHLLRALACEPALGDAGVAREEALQGFALDPGFGAASVFTAEAEGASPSHPVALLAPPAPAPGRASWSCRSRRSPGRRPRGPSPTGSASRRPSARP